MFSHPFNKSFENSSFLNEYLEISINLVLKNSTKMSTNKRKKTLTHSYWSTFTSTFLYYSFDNWD